MGSAARAQDEARCCPEFLARQAARVAGLVGRALRSQRGARPQQRRTKPQFCPCYASFLSPLFTSSRLVPKSLNRAAAALRPGRAVIEPPGAVQAPVWYKPDIGNL